MGFDAPYSGSPLYPAEFQNDIFFTDVNDGEVFVVDVNDRSDVKFLYSSEDFPVSFSEGPDGYVYVANLAGNITRLLIEPIPVLPPNTLTPHGSASVANNVFTLTTAGGQAGTAMSTGRIDVRQNFTVAFDVNLGTSDGGADGAAIVFHNDPRGANAVGAPGSGLAVGGIQNGLAIEFDTYNSSAADLAGAGMPGSDIASDHTGFLDTNSAFATTPVALPNIENGAWHPVVVTWNATTQTLSYTFDGQPMGTPLTGNIATQFLGGSNFAYFGFGAGTGGLSNTQSVRNINVAATFEGQTPGNNPPIANADTATTAAGTAVNIVVLANDSDPENNPLTVTGVSNFVGGTATVNGNNTVTYTPTAGFSGSGGFTYTIYRRNDAEIRGGQRDGLAVAPPPGAVTLTPHGSASVANNVFTLTTAGGQAGTAMSTGRIDVRQNFTVAFDVNLGTSDAGADGAAIVFHNDPRGANAVGAPGSGLAVGGIQNGLAIEFDTYNSSAADLAGAGMPGSDIASDHTGFLDTNSAFATTPVALPNIENGAWHPVVVTWNATTQTLSYTFDGQPRGTLHRQHRYPIPRRFELRLFRLRRRHRRIEQHAKRAQHQRRRHLRRPDAGQ